MRITKEYKENTLKRIEALSMPEPNSGCTIFYGATDTKGYPQIHFKGKTRYAFHIMLYLFKGIKLDSYSNKFHWDHLCDNKTCINVDHVKRVTARENILRGTSLSAVNARMTHCFRGHEIIPENRYVRKNRAGRGECKICVKAKSKINYKLRRL